jgi:hypothetical protein
MHMLVAPLAVTGRATCCSNQANYCAMTVLTLIHGGADGSDCVSRCVDTGACCIFWLTSCNVGASSDPGVGRSNHFKGLCAAFPS